MSREFAYTFGALDGISVEGSVVSADGWVVGLEENVDDIVLEYELVLKKPPRTCNMLTPACVIRTDADSDYRGSFQKHPSRQMKVS